MLLDECTSLTDFQMFVKGQFLEQRIAGLIVLHKLRPAGAADGLGPTPTVLLAFSADFQVMVKRPAADILILVVHQT